MRAGRCLPRRRAVFMADLAAEPLPAFEVDEGFLREAEAVERGERMPTWHRRADR